jgi:hypothetical protein
MVANDNTTSPALPGDGFNNDDRLIQGDLIKFDNKKTPYWSGPGGPLDTTIKLLLVDWMMMIQRWANNQELERYTTKDFPQLPDLDELNDQVPLEQREVDPYGDGVKRRAPYQRAFVLYFVDKNFIRSTWIGRSNGASIAYGEITRAIADRQKLTGLCGTPVILPSTKTFTSRRYGEITRPYFQIVGWLNGGSGAAQIEPPKEPQLEAPKGPPTVEEDPSPVGQAQRNLEKLKVAQPPKAGNENKAAGEEKKTTPASEFLDDAMPF